MANPGVGSKFVSVNLNKSYGQAPSSSGRIRPSAHHGSGTGSGGMVVLGRQRSSASAGTKGGSRLSVPPPLNLPSLRKEHERHDQSSALGGPAGLRNAGSGSGHGPAAVGWSRPVISAALLEKDGKSGNDGQRVGSPSDGGMRGSSSSSSSVYMPPAARLGSVAQQQQEMGLGRDLGPVEKAVVLRGEDFPTLHATLVPVSSTLTQKQKYVLLHQKQRIGEEEVLEEQSATSAYSRSRLPMRPQVGSARISVPSGSDENVVSGHVPSGPNDKEHSRKLDRFLPGPLPVVRLRHTSDWEDDERDTGHGFLNRDKDHRGLTRNQAVEDREFDLPRSGLPQMLGRKLSNGWGLHDSETGNKEVFRGDTHGRDVATPTRDVRDGSSWRVSSLLVKDGFGAREIAIDRNALGARPFSPSREMGKDNKHGESTYRDSGGSGFRAAVNGAQGSSYFKRDSGYEQSGQNGNRVAQLSNSRVVEQSSHDRYGGLPSRNRGDVLQRSSIAKASFSFGSKGLPINDPILNFGREKRLFPNGGKPYMEDDFDTRDPFLGGHIGDGKIVKRKKDVLQQADYHDPEREDFEAALEREQMLQELERKRVAEEQERARELARREEEERQRRAREDEERRRRLEEEAREAAWRAEQEKLEALKRAEEQKMAREEEKRRILLEEERRKEAAKQKLLELEARIARRQAEVSNDDKFGNAVPRMSRGTDGPRKAHAGDCEDGERMERITSSASSDSSIPNRSIETGSKPHFFRDGNAVFFDKGKHSNLWTRDSFENGSSSSFLPQQDHENAYFSRRDGMSGGKVYPRKDFYEGSGALSHRTSSRGGMPDLFEDYSHLRGNRWNFEGDSDHYNRNTELDAEFPDNSMDKFRDIGWGHGPARGSFHAPYADRSFQNTDVDGLSSFGKSRHSMRQPRVLPPPSLPSLHRSTFVAECESRGPSVFLNEQSKYTHSGGINEQNMPAGYETNFQDTIEERVIVAVEEKKIILNEQKYEKPPTRCDSQFSLSVSSPPDSPTHFSHDDLDDSGGFTVLPDTDDSKQMVLSESENVEGVMNVTAPAMVSTNENDKWGMENSAELQQQEEYDEEDTYNEDELHEVDNENLNTAQDFEGLHSKEQDTVEKFRQVVLGLDNCVVVEMANDDEFENAPRNDEKVIETQEASVGIDHVGLVGNGLGLQYDNGLSKRSIGSSSKMIDETERALQELTIQSPVASPNYILNRVEVSSTSDMPDQHAVAPSTKSSVPSQPGQVVLPVGSSVHSQAEVPPVKLQFGLFSGPSLIPSPVPAIQIGSIQMPLIHPQIGPSLSHPHQSQPPLFQFGQLRYTPQLSQGILPIAHQTLSISQPAASAHYSVNQNSGGSLLNQVGTGIPLQSPHPNDTLPFIHLDNEPNLLPKTFNSSQDNVNKDQEFIADSAKDEVLPSQNQPDGSLFVENRTISESVPQLEYQGHCNETGENKSINGNREAQGQQHKGSASSLFFSNERGFGSSKAPGTVPGSKGKRFIYAVRTTDTRPSVSASEASHTDTSGVQRKARRNIQRSEFRVRENDERKQSEDLVSSNYSKVDEKTNLNVRVPGMSSKGGNKKDTMSNKSTKPLHESEASFTLGSLSSHSVDTERDINKASGRDALSKRPIPMLKTPGERNLQSNVVSEDVDAPLQSGVVRVFKQPGIEAPSDEDDFIEVRSKRQMLNDRREQREKEIKAKSKAIKAPRKPRSVTISANSSRRAAPLSGGTVTGVHSEPVVSDGWVSANDEVSTGFGTGISSPPLPPIGTPATCTDPNAERRSSVIKSVNASSATVMSSGGTNFVTGLPFENKSTVLDNVITPFGSWANVCVNQQMIAIAQNQVDETLKPARFDAHVPPIGDHNGSCLETGKPSTSILTQEKSFSSSASPLNSLLAGEKIQFGAVTSPTMLPPSSLPISSSTGPSGSCRSDVSTDHNLHALKGECTMIFEKEKQADASCVELEDPEAEAEAAASAVAVAAISSDELVGNGLGVSSVSVSDAKSFGGANMPELPSECGMVGDQQLPNQSRGEESLTVSLPADLSVETPALSLWPPLPSPHNSSGPMLSRFPGAPPHFPCYEMSHMLGGPFFTFGPHDESGSTQPQSQTSNTTATGSLGAWQPCHSGVESFYGPPAGFTSPFINPGGIPGVQGPPHMVVYNHYAPVGQFGQVGLGYMATTFIPSGKQPDWNHTPVSSAVGISEGDTRNLNSSSGQHNPSNIPASIQHLAPGSPLLPMASPVALFDLSPFQSSAEVPVQAHWPHIPTSAVHSVPPSMPPLQQQAEGGGFNSQISHGMPVDSSNGKSFLESCSSKPADSCMNFPPASGSATQFLGEDLIEPPSATSTHVQTSRSTTYSSGNGNRKADNVTKSSSKFITPDASQRLIVSSSSCSSLSMSTSTMMAPADQQKNRSVPHNLHTFGYAEQKGSGVSQKFSSGGDWHRRGGFHGRNQNSGAEKNSTSKMKQIYVAKPVTSMPTTTG